MIVFDLQCAKQHVFEAWFGSSADYAAQNKRDLIACPYCGDTSVTKAVMAPNVAAKGNRTSARPAPVESQSVATVDAGAAESPAPPEMKKMLALMAEFQAKVEETHENVGDKFVEEARKIHYGETDAKLIYGQASLADAAELQEEGIDVLPLPFRGKKSRRLDA